MPSRHGWKSRRAASPAPLRPQLTVHPFSASLMRYLAPSFPPQAMSLLLRKIYRRLVPRKPRIHPFDRLHGVDTSGLIDHSLLGSGHSHDQHNTAYWGTAPSLMRQILTRWEDSLAGTSHACRDYTLLDIGCGKGRVIMLASGRPFHRITGVELDPGLARIAATNLTRWKQHPRPCMDLEALHADALEIPLPETPVLIYLFNPFGAPVMQLLLERLQHLSKTRSTPIDILYTHPLQAELFKEIPGMRLLWEDTINFSPEDASADIFKATTERCNLYRLSPPPRL